MIGKAHRGDFSCHLFHTKRTHCATPATGNAVVAAWGATILVSKRPCKFHRSEALDVGKLVPFVFIDVLNLHYHGSLMDASAFPFILDASRVSQSL